jgi:hypothetical protein
MKIRREQMAAFEDAALQKWEQELAEYARAFAPQQTAVAGEENVRLAIKSVRQRCEYYGFTDRGPFRLFLELVLSFGSGFDTDPLLPWASSVLQLDLDQHRRAGQLYDRSKEYFLLVNGKDDEFAVKAIQRALTLSEDSIGTDLADVDSRIASLLQTTYPEKYVYCGPAAIDALLRTVNETAYRYTIATNLGRAIVAGVLFAFGHQADSDPLYPWVGRALRGEGQDRAVKLHERFEVYLEHMLPVLIGAK